MSKRVKIKPNDDMTNIGWRKSITIKYPYIKDGKIFCQEIDFYVKDFGVCKICGSNSYLWLVRQLHGGVGLACTYCRTYDSTVSKEAGIPRKPYEITLQECIEIFKAKGIKENDRDLRPFLKLRKKSARKYAKRKRPEELQKFKTKKSKKKIDKFAEALEELEE